MYSMPKLAAPLLLAILLLGLLVVVPEPAAATASDDHFAVPGDALCTDINMHTDADCWSHTSGGAGGAGVPGPANRAIFDGNSVGDGSQLFGAGGSVLELCMSNSCHGGTSFSGSINFNGIAVGTGGFWTAGTVSGSATVTNGPFIGTFGTVSLSQLNMVRTVAGTSTLNVGAANTFGELKLRGDVANSNFDSTAFAANDIVTEYLEIEESTYNVGAHDIAGTCTGPSGDFCLLVRLLESTPVVGSASLIMDNIVVQHNGPADLQMNFINAQPGAGPAVTLQDVRQYSTSTVEFVTTGSDATNFFAFQNFLTPNTAYTLKRNGVLILTETSDANGLVSHSVDANAANAGTVTWLIEGPSPGGGFPPPPPAQPAVAQFCAGNTLTLRDNRPEAANGVLWIWNWGDGTQTTTSGPVATHTYSEERVYAVRVSSQDASGRVSSFSGTVDMTGVGCDIGLFAQIVGPFLLALLIILAFTLFVVMVTGKRKGVRRPLAIAILVLAVVIGVLVAYGWNPALPGGIEFLPQRI